MTFPAGSARARLTLRHGLATTLVLAVGAAGASALTASPASALSRGDECQLDAMLSQQAQQIAGNAYQDNFGDIADGDTEYQAPLPGAPYTPTTGAVDGVHRYPSC